MKKQARRKYIFMATICLILISIFYVYNKAFLLKCDIQSAKQSIKEFKKHNPEALINNWAFAPEKGIDVSIVGQINNMNIFSNIRINRLVVSSDADIKSADFSTLHVNQFRITGKGYRELPILPNKFELRCLEIQNTNIANIAGLKNTTVNVLRVIDSPVTSLPQFVYNTINRIALIKTNVDNISSLSKMQLITVSLSGSPVSDISPISKSKVISLDISNTDVSDISRLNISRLSYLLINGSKIYSISVLDDAKNLVYLSFSNGQIKEIPKTIMNKLKHKELINGLTILSEDENVIASF